MQEHQHLEEEVASPKEFDREKSKDALAGIFSEYKDVLLSYAFFKLEAMGYDQPAIRSAAEDVVQDVFTYLIRRSEKVDYTVYLEESSESVKKANSVI